MSNDADHAWRRAPRRGEQSLHRHPGMPPEHGGRLLEDGVPGERTRHRHDHKGDGARKGEGFALKVHFAQVFFFFFYW